MNDQKTVTIDLWKALAILVGAILVSAGAGIYGSFATINADHYVLANNVAEVTELKSGQREILTRINAIGSDVSEIKGQLKIK